MKILALDASEQACSVALMDGEEVEALFQVAPRQHARLLLPMAKQLLSVAGYQTTHLDAIAFARGPGAFTGLRIAASAAQGLALGADLPLVPVSTLQAMALRAVMQLDVESVLVALDARMGEVYLAGFSLNDARIAPCGAHLPVPLSAAQLGLNILIEEQVAQPDQLNLPCSASQLPDFQLGVGSGGLYLSHLETQLGQSLRWQQQWHCHAEQVAQLGAQIFSNSGGVALELAIPVYLRDSVAQVK